MDRLEDFKEFLVENNALEAYFLNMNKETPNNSLKHDAVSFILFAFTWKETPEGEKFWGNLHCKWVNKIFRKNFTATKQEVINYLSENYKSIWEN